MYIPTIMNRSKTERGIILVLSHISPVPYLNDYLRNESLYLKIYYYFHTQQLTKIYIKSIYLRMLTHSELLI